MLEIKDSVKDEVAAKLAARAKEVAGTALEGCYNLNLFGITRDEIWEAHKLSRWAIPESHQEGFSLIQRQAKNNAPMQIGDETIKQYYEILFALKEGVNAN